MSESAAFLKFLEAGTEKGGFETDDVLSALLPLMKQAHAAHEAGLVAPLDGLMHLSVSEQGHLMFDPAKATVPQKNLSRIEALQSPVSHAVEVVAESRRITDIDASSLTISDLGIGSTDQNLTRPVYLPSYRSWEDLAGHH